MLNEMVTEILNGGEILVNFKFKIKQKSQFEFVPQDTLEFKSNQNLNSTLYHEIPRSRFWPLIYITTRIPRLNVANEILIYYICTFTHTYIHICLIMCFHVADDILVHYICVYSTHIFIHVYTCTYVYNDSRDMNMCVYTHILYKYVVGDI